MKRKYVYISIAGLLSAAAAGVFWQQGDSDRANARLAVVGPEHPNGQAEAIQESTVVESVGESISGSRAEIEPGNSCEYEIVYLQQKSGAVIESKRCVSSDPDRTKHPYQSYTNAELGSLAYSDAAAAEILGMRLRDTDQKSAMSLVIRAAALSGGNTSPIRKYFNAYPHPTFIDGEPVLKTIHAKYVLSAVSELLGDQRLGTSYWEQQVIASSPNPAETLAYLKGKAEEIVGEMRQIQIEVSGEATIGGRDDA